MESRAENFYPWGGGLKIFGIGEGQALRGGLHLDGGGHKAGE